MVPKLFQGNNHNEERAFLEFPFKCSLSFIPLINFWKNHSEDSTLFRYYSDVLEKELRNAPELMKPITDFSIVEKYQPIVNILLTAVFPQVSGVFSAASIPFNFKAFYSTPDFKRVIISEETILKSWVNLDERSFEYGKTILAYLEVLRNYYDINLTFDYPLMFKVKDSLTGLDRFYKLSFNTDFAEIIARKPVIKLTDLQREELLSGIGNIEKISEFIPSGNFEFQGFTIMNIIDVTDQEVLSQLKFELLNEETLISLDHFESLQEKIRIFAQKPDLKLGLISVQGNQESLSEYSRRIGNSFILSEECRVKCPHTVNTIYQKILEKGNCSALIIEDLSKVDPQTEVESTLLKMGINNLVIAPLVHKNKIIGLLELGSPHPGDLNYLNTIKFAELLPLFASAIRRISDEFENRIQGVIKEKATAIHPSVEWRFRRAAVRYIHNSTNKLSTQIEPIIFKDVYPLYGQTDIKGSSEQRNEAIRADLIEQLELTIDLLSLIKRSKQIVILDEIIFRLKEQIKRIRKGLSTSDEVFIINTIHNEITPFLDHVLNYYPDLKDDVLKFRAATDGTHGVVYKKRKDFEESFTMITETVSELLEAEEAAAQSVYPHYFEKYKTDGVEHNIYAGASLIEDQVFDPLYIKNLRLWQLMVICEIAVKTNEIKSTLKVPLETTHLILAQSIPISIRFRFDEKKFDVDGAYNIRYEIIKKRIDKSVIKGTRERLTQPGKIAIIYTQLSECDEYRQYITYLQSIGILEQLVEEVELDDFQGVQGLKALRVKVNLKYSDTAKEGRTAAQEYILAETF